MTAPEMKFEFDLRLKALADIRYELFDTLEINRLFRESERDLILKYYSVFDRSELEKKVLSNLIANYVVSIIPVVSATNLPNGHFIPLPTDMFLALEESARLQDITEPAQVKPITYDMYITSVRNPFKNPCGRLVWRLDYTGNKHELITDGATLLSYQMRYIRHSVPIDVDNDVASEINADFHIEIVNNSAKKPVKGCHRRTAN
jgi:hypothetical protein